jgi:hypothetical protein
MKLPNSHSAYIPQAKLRDYLLSSSHPEGGPKSAFFEIAGFSLKNVEALEKALLAIAANEEVVFQFEFPFGNKYIIDGKLPSNQGTEIPLRTVWVIDIGENTPCFVTAYPL